MEGVSSNVALLRSAMPLTPAARDFGRPVPHNEPRACVEEVAGTLHRESVPNGCVWQSRVGDQSVGILGLVHVSRHVVRLSPFRIAPQWQHTAALTRLLERAHEYCWNHSCLKVLVEDGSAPHWLYHLMDRHGFHIARRRELAGRTVMEFYLDLYHAPHAAVGNGRGE
jgi:hypothetical protein